ncbi:hypothetical protein EV182_003782 [Spiromyces aspiralis]|uniref:Uncharacterized protein n=1 Tax=Spiromyces aspiralis TaxID=68401 RepID=A0ACC1HS34_9FUNG|nr:hypothetical protein EV182_003782 [Spiromyces aspiralis]
MGQLLHYGFDALLVAMVLAGIRRTTGYTLKAASKRNIAAQDQQQPTWIDRYLQLGERALDATVAFMANFPNWFEKR